jgi:hypothetical protein
VSAAPQTGWKGLTETAEMAAAARYRWCFDHDKCRAGDQTHPDAGGISESALEKAQLTNETLLGNEGDYQEV